MAHVKAQTAHSKVHTPAQSFYRKDKPLVVAGGCGWCGPWSFGTQQPFIWVKQIRSSVSVCPSRSTAVSAMDSSKVAATNRSVATSTDTSTDTSCNHIKNHNSSALPSIMPKTFQQVLCARSASQAGEALAADTTADTLSEAGAQQLMTLALEAGNISLALSIHHSMCTSRCKTSSSRHPSSDTAHGTDFAWPQGTISTTIQLVLGLCRLLAVNEATALIADIKLQGLPRNDVVGFGKVITSPLAPGHTLTVVQPQEGSKLVADAASKYEFEVFSGSVITCKSAALQRTGGLLHSAARAAAQAVGLLHKPAAAAAHELVVQAPSGVSRTFCVATETAEVPAQVGERVSVVCSPGPGPRRSSKPRKLLAPSPPGTKPGEPLVLTNHRTGVVTPLLRPPPPEHRRGLPAWVVPTVLLLGGGEAASALVDPALPSLLAMGVASVAGSVMLSNAVLLPRLRQLPDSALVVERTRQQLLGQYSQLMGKVGVVMSECTDDVRVLARLWQLLNKMQRAAGSMPSDNRATAEQSARMQRVDAARVNVEQRLAKKMELLDGYARVMTLIEIEVEMESEVPAAELAGIEAQMQQLVDMERVQEEWAARVEAQEELERLLRSS